MPRRSNGGLACLTTSDYTERHEHLPYEALNYGQQEARYWWRKARGKRYVRCRACNRYYWPDYGPCDKCVKEAE